MFVAKFECWSQTISWRNNGNQSHCLCRDFSDFASHTIILTRANGRVIKVDVNKASEDSTFDLQIYPVIRSWFRAGYSDDQLVILSGKKAGTVTVARHFPFSSWPGNGQ